MCAVMGLSLGGTFRLALVGKDFERDIYLNFLIPHHANFSEQTSVVV